MNNMWKKIASTLLSVFVFTALNFCLVECAFATCHHDHSESVAEVGHNHEASGEDHDDSGSEKHDAGSLCCSSLVADQIPSGNFFDAQFLKNHALSSFITVDPLFVVSPLNYPQYRVEFPQGTSPPAVFLSTYFTHAPPVIL